MAIGYVLINTVAGKEHDVYIELSKIKEIIELIPLIGEYDIIAKIEADNFDGLSHIVFELIRSVPGITNTKTLTEIQF